MKQVEFDDEDPPTVSIIDGGLGQSTITLKIVAKPGRNIMELYTFYYIKRFTESKLDDPVNLKRFLESCIYIVS